MTPSIDGATVIGTGFSRGSGYDELTLKQTDGKIIKLYVETTRDDDTCIGITYIEQSLKTRIEKCQDEIKRCRIELKKIEKM